MEAIFDVRGRPARKASERPMKSRKHGAYTLVTLRFIDGHGPAKVTMTGGHFGKLKVIKGNQALVWRRVEALLAERMEPNRALRQATAELSKGILWQAAAE